MDRNRALGSHGDGTIGADQGNAASVLGPTQRTFTGRVVR